MSSGTDSDIHFEIDLVVLTDGEPIAVADTKYKTPASPSTADISQVVSYAAELGVNEALLIYPDELPSGLEITVGDIHIQSLQFGIDRELEENGNRFLSDLYTAIDVDPTRTESL